MASMRSHSSTSAGRAILVDHACVLPYGHNRNAMVIFARALSRHFARVTCLAPRQLALEAQADEIERSLFCPYFSFVGAAEQGAKPRAAHRTATLRHRLKLSLVRRANSAFGFDYRRWRTRVDWRTVFASHEIGADDLIFFPSADYYGCLALLDHLHTLPGRYRPSVHVRLIGVMENAGVRVRAPLRDLLAQVDRAVAAGCRLSLSAETPKYADYLRGLTDQAVIYLPYPLARPQAIPNWRPRKTVAMLGQGRREKGFFRLMPIIAAVMEAGHIDKFEFDVQDIQPDKTSFQASYRDLLTTVPNLRLRPAQITQAEIDDANSGADILLLPYDSAGYEFRGSAVYQEGTAFGRTAISSTGTAIADMIVRYGNGLVASSDIDFADKLVALASTPREKMIEITTAARQAYEIDFEAGLAGAIKSAAGLL